MMKTGLNEQTSVGRCGAYRRDADHANVVQLTTCVARDMDFHAVHGGRIRWLGGPALPDSHRRTSLGRSWTGRVYRYEWDAGGFDAYLKTTLPGPMFVPQGKEFHWRWAVDNGVPSARALPDGREFVCAWTQEDLGQVVMLNNWGMPTLLVASAPIAKMKWISHEHMSLEFGAPGTRVLFVPLLDTADVSTDITPWLELIAAPPVSCREDFDVRGDTVVIQQTFEGACLAPVPPVSTFSPLQDQPDARMLTKGFMGEYRVTSGSTREMEIPMGWSKARLRATRLVDATGLSGIPDELAYAGDVTWEPGTAMDQLLALRVWAPLAEICPPSIWAKLRPQLAPPTADQLRASLELFTEPASGRQWAKEAQLFGGAGDVAYDSDWYNGFELSGMWRAANCADLAIAKPAQALVAAAKGERDLLTSYFTIFHDWELGAAWGDARASGWNTDCSHNGLEGLLAQSEMCRAEGDATGADFAFYLAAKTASALMAAEWLVDYQCAVGFARQDGGLTVSAERGAQDGEMLTFGMDGIYTARGVCPQSAASKNPYALAGNFPEFCTLQKQYGRQRRYREIVALWEHDFPDRYSDWHAFYAAGNPYAQEARVQAAVMYHLAPEIAFRLWALDEDPDAVEKRFSTPLNLAEQLWCRAGARLEEM
jgi:hypothetical protein